MKNTNTIADQMKIEDSVLFRRCPPELHEYLMIEVRHFMARGGVATTRYDDGDMDLSEETLATSFRWNRSHMGEVFWRDMHVCLLGNIGNYSFSYLGTVERTPGLNLNMRYREVGPSGESL